MNLSLLLPRPSHGGLVLHRGLRHTKGLPVFSPLHARPQDNVLLSTSCTYTQQVLGGFRGLDKEA